MEIQVTAAINPMIGEFLSTIWREDREVIEDIMERGFRIAEVIVVLEKAEFPEPPTEPPKTARLPHGANFDKSGHY